MVKVVVPKVVNIFIHPLCILEMRFVIKGVVIYGIDYKCFLNFVYELFLELIFN